MYISRVRTMKAKSTLLKRMRMKIDRIVIAFVLGILLFDSVWARVSQIQSEPVPVVRSKARSSGRLLVSAVDSHEMSGAADLPTGVMHVDRYEFARQIAISILVEHDHKISDHEVSFMRDHKSDGTAISQFADAFGRAIERGVTRFEMPARSVPDQPSQAVSSK